MSPSSTLVFGLAIAALPACGAAATPSELVHARSGYAAAEAGKAPALAPVALHEARRALDAAERANKEAPASSRAVSLAYVALRKSEIAVARAGIAAALSDAARAKSDASAAKAQGIATARDAADVLHQEIAEQNGEIARDSDRIAAEQRARAEAEARAKDALQKLASVAGTPITEEPRGSVFSMPADSLFVSGKAALQPDAHTKLDAIAEALTHQDGHRIVVEAHTDARSTEASNRALATARATAVRDYLVSRGVDGDRITASGVGQARPIADNGTIDGRARNRRVEVVVQPISDPY